MRVNMDSSIASDARFKLLAHRLGCDWTEVIGRCYLVWLQCYDRRSEVLRGVEIDIAAERKGFADALCAEKLATKKGAERVRIHGVKARIDFLKAQAEKGSKGGKTRRKRREANAQANASPPAQAKPQAYSLTHTQDQSLTQSLQQQHRGGGVAADVLAEFNERLDCALAPTPDNLHPIEQALGAGFTFSQLKAIAWYAQRWSDEAKVHASPASLYRLTAEAGKKTASDYLVAAGQRWSRENPETPWPWEAM